MSLSKSLTLRSRLVSLRTSPVAFTQKQSLVTSSQRNQFDKHHQNPDVTTHNSIHAMYNNENQSAMEHLYHPNLKSVHYGDMHAESHKTDTFSPTFNTVFDE
ncbi:hypothetical protein DM01DRAFT_1337806 [Hesseltinella vesiculosa]|uniref:Uncharacterized protein n=1 Tax=Hesseltinella vesiculosa TaxID=101127 RepID=A0A1X2GBR1_9FUNG|nr:hypothetical protein DM01DRAFT_1337806 [Hesseltinella vesiculosa]